jgi:hypothetical protein
MQRVGNTVFIVRLHLGQELSITNHILCRLQIRRFSKGVMTAVKTVSTNFGGLVNDLSSVIEFFPSLSTSAMALSNAGKATSRSACASAAILSHSAASFAIFSLSASTAFFCSSSFPTVMRS